MIDPVFAFLFETPLAALLAGATAVGIPVLIHLLRRFRRKVVDWPTMRFLLEAKKTREKKLRLEQWLLLLLRCLMVFFLASACASAMPWAEPWWRKVFPSMEGIHVLGARRTHAIIVLDASLSMLARQGQTTAFDRGKDKALEILDSLRSGDAASVVLLSWPARGVVLEPSENLARVREEVRALTPVHACSDLSGALALVDSILQRTPGRFQERKIIFLTDFCKSSWIVANPGQVNGLFEKIQGQGQIALLDVGAEVDSNASVSGIELDGPLAGVQGETRIVAKVQAFGARKGETKAQLLVSKIRNDLVGVFPAAVASESLELDQARQTRVVLKHKFAEPGTYAIQVKITGDALEADDSCQAVIQVRKDLKVMLIDGRPASRELEKGTGFLQVALDNEGLESGPVLIRPQVLEESRFADEGTGALEGFDCVFCCDVSRWRAAEARRLETHVRRGGGAVFFLGNQADPASYNEFLHAPGKELLPFRLEKGISSGSDFLYQFLPEPGSSQVPPLSAFKSPEDLQSLLAPRFQKVFQLLPALKNPPRALATFRRVPVAGKVGDPAGLPASVPALAGWQPPFPQNGQKELAARQARLRGWVYLVNTSANTDWNNWPAYPSYVPFTQELLLSACAGLLREQSQEATMPLEDFTEAVSGDVQVQLPDGKQETVSLQPMDGPSRFSYPGTNLSGFYLARYPNSPVLNCFAVNPMTVNKGDLSNESDLTRAAPEEIKLAYPGGKLAIAKNLWEVPWEGAQHEGAAAGGVKGVIGGKIAGYLLFLVVLLALAEFLFSWYLDSGRSPGTRPGQGLGWLLNSLSILCLLALGLLVFTLAHESSTGDFFGFMGNQTRSEWEARLGLEGAGEGESLQWKLREQESFPRVLTAPSFRLGAILALLAGLLAMTWPLLRGKMVLGTLHLVCLRLGFWGILLWVLLPRISLGFEKMSWPDLAIVIDDSQSMSYSDRYQGEGVARLYAELGSRDGRAPTRLSVVQGLLSEKDGDFLQRLISRRFRLHLYRCSAQAERIATLSKREEIPAALEAIAKLRADSFHDSSRLGASWRQVLNDFRGASLNGVVFLTDGIVTDGEDLGRVAKYASQAGVPLFPVGIGEGLDPKDIALRDIQAPDELAFGDKAVFDVRLAATGFSDLKAEVLLREKGSPEILDRQEVSVDPNGTPVLARLGHRPKKEGRIEYEIEIPPVRGESDLENNRGIKVIQVQAAKTARVLYVEGCRRYEYHYLKMIMERQALIPGGKKLIDLSVLLLEADPDFPAQDKTAIAGFPTRVELFQYDVVVLGDFDPRPRDNPRASAFLQDLSDFVREKGGGLLFVAGPRHLPRDFANTPIRDALPVEVQPGSVDNEPEEGIFAGFKPLLTPAGQVHPIFRFHPDEKENADTWAKLRDLFWHASGYSAKKAAEVLATLPGGGEGALQRGAFPLVIQQYYGAGRVLFFGFDETWRWGFREDQAYYNQFWVQTLRYLARGTTGKTELKLDRQGAYRRGDPIRVLARFPGGGQNPGLAGQVRVGVEKKALQGGRERESRTLALSPVAGSSSSFEGVIENARDGQYEFTLVEPSLDPVPKAQCKVFPPPLEMERLKMAEADLIRAAEQTRGKYFSLAQARELPSGIPPGFQAAAPAPTPPRDLWNHPALFALALACLGLDWFLRRRLNLL